MSKINKLKPLLPALVLSLISSFMLFIYEPIVMYANNVNDFWFDFYTIINPTLLIFLIAFLLLSIFFIFFFVLSYFTNKPKIYQYALIISTLVFIIAYIHGNFLTSFLPPLDGTAFDWNDFLPNFISIIICLILIAIIVFCCIKFPIEKIVKYTIYAPITAFILLVISLITTVATTPVFKPKEIIITSTSENINTASTNKNFMILLIDAVDSRHFDQVINSNPEFQAMFKDFTYFPDTLSGYAFTRDSIPFIFSGIWNENQEDFSAYSTKAFDNSIFLNQLSTMNYNKNFYDHDFIWQSNKALNFTNIHQVEKNIKITNLAKQEIKYALFKYLPHPLKQFSKIETINFNTAKDSFNESDIDFYNTILSQPITKIGQNYFQYIHIEGGHVPFDTDENLNKIENGTYHQKLTATAKIVQKYLNRLKSSEAYNNSTIVIMADHGYALQDSDGRQNPALYIKGINELHNNMLISDKQISYADMANALIELLSDKSSTEIFQNIPTEGRVRRYINNPFNAEEHMIEYEQTGKAWELETFKPTGKEFNL